MMFGIPVDIKGQSLYLLYDMIENQIIEIERNISNCMADEQDKIIALKAKKSVFEAEMSKFRMEVENQLKNEFQFSIEELYSIYGQYENRFISIEFHKFSESAMKYGRNISGCLFYTKYERQEFESVITSDSITRTNGLVKFEVSNDSKLSAELIQELKTSGFLSGDIYQIHSLNLPLIKSYGVQGQKEIPNTIEIKFDPSGTDFYLLNRNLFIDRLRGGGKLADFEWSELAGYSCYYEPEGLETILDKIFDESGNKFPEVRLAELTVKYHHLDINAQELIEFSDLVKKREKERQKILQQEISRSTNKKLKDLETEFPEMYKELIDSITGFREEVFSFMKSFKPIFLDYERFVHIFLRHASELKIEGKFEGKTKFQYSAKDIRRLLKIVIERLLPEINDSLSKGIDYRANGAKVLYYNGNHYNIHISKDGRVLAFHPIENPTE